MSQATITEKTREAAERLHDMARVAAYDGASCVVIPTEDVLALAAVLSDFADSVDHLVLEAEILVSQNRGENA